MYIDNLPNFYPTILLESFPHVFDIIDIHWGTDTFHETLNGFAFADRTNYNGDVTYRQGFPIVAMQEIQKLIEIHNEMFPKFKPPTELPFTY